MSRLAEGHAATVSSLVADLRGLSVAPGAIVLVHASLSQLVAHRPGSSAGVGSGTDAQADDGPCGRVVPYHPGGGAQPSSHRSFAASGPAAERLMAQHDLDSPVGVRSPLAAMYDAGADVVLLGVGHDKATALHLAEDRVDYVGKHRVRNGAPLLVDGCRTWVTFEELWPNAAGFAELGAAFDRDTGMAVRGSVGQAVAIRVPIREYVDFAAQWLPRHRAERGPQADATGW